MKSLIVILLLFSTALPCLGQKILVRFRVPKDTVVGGELYRNDISVTLAKGDSILLYEVYMNDVKIPVKGAGASIYFRGFFGRNSDLADSVIRSSSYLLNIKLKTLKADTIIRKEFKYYVIVNPAEILRITDEKLYDIVLFPDVPAVPEGIKDFEKALSAKFLNGKRGIITMSFVVNTDGTMGKYRFQYNTFKGFTNQMLIDYIKGIKWVPAKIGGKVVSSFYSVVIKQ